MTSIAGNSVCVTAFNVSITDQKRRLWPPFVYVNFVTYYRAGFARLGAIYSQVVNRGYFLLYFRANIARSFVLIYICAHDEH